MSDEYDNPLRHLQQGQRPELNEMAVAVAATIVIWALATLVVVIAGYHGSGPTNAVNLATVLAGIAGFIGRRWQLGRRYRAANRRRLWY
jgi:TRAP-type C4-dicarboxylate transport system permease large subunit